MHFLSWHLTHQNLAMFSCRARTRHFGTIFSQYKYTVHDVSRTFLLSKCCIPEAICRAIFISSRSFSAHLIFSYLPCSPGAGLEVNKLSRVPPGIKSVTRRIFSNQIKNSGWLYLAWPSLRPVRRVSVYFEQYPSFMNIQS